MTKTAQEAGIRFPVFLTRAVFDTYVAVPPDVTGQDEAGRLWDVVWMLRFGIIRARPGVQRIPSPPANLYRNAGFRALRQPEPGAKGRHLSTPPSFPCRARLASFQRRTVQTCARPRRLPCKFHFTAAPLRFRGCPLIRAHFPHRGRPPQTLRCTHGFRNSQASRIKRDCHRARCAESVWFRSFFLRVTVFAPSSSPARFC